MPDPGVAPEPPIADGQKDLMRLQAAGFKPDEIASYQNQQTQKLRAGGFTGQEIDAYWGARGPSPAVQDATRGNVQRAAAAQGNAVFLQDVVGTIGAALNVDTQDFMKFEKQHGAAAAGEFATAATEFQAATQPDKDQATDPIGGVGNLLGSAMHLGTGVWANIAAYPQAA